MDIELTRIKQDTFRYWFEDGLSEIVVGALFVIISMFILLQGVLEPGSIVSGLSGVILIFVVSFGIFLSRWLIKTLKERFSYPRTGYISYQKSTSLQRIISASLGIAVGVIVIWLTRFSPQIAVFWTPLILGLILAGFMIMIGFRTGMIRYQIMAILILISGVFLSISGIAESLITGILFSAQGLIFLLSGIITLLRYLGKTQSFQGDVQDD